ncbi:MAG: PKD domain-containing protein [Candidatus Bathyarchaeota archaeon]|nr:MAG: PKD domain-containing protein [Candidatus Bathyarchaeota archaeon]
MKPLSVVYSIRICLGVVAAALCILLRLDTLWYNILLGISFYILTYYFLKHFFGPKVEDPSKITTMGVGAYFLTFALAFGLFFTLMIPTAVLSHTPEFPIVGQTVTFDATGSYNLFGGIESFTWDFNDTGKTTTTDLIVTHVYTTPANYTVTLTVENNQGHTSTSQKVVTVTTSTET